MTRKNATLAIFGAVLLATPGSAGAQSAAVEQIEQGTELGVEGRPDSNNPQLDRDVEQDLEEAQEAIQEAEEDVSESKELRENIKKLTE